MMPAYGSSVRGLRLLLLFGAASIVHLGCLDLTIPPNREAGSAGGALPVGSADFYNRTLSANEIEALFEYAGP